MGEPAPFTRAGFGVGGAMKPELCDDGGNTFYDGLTESTSRKPESGVMTMSSRYLDGLFTTDVGTSYAAPLVAHKAALLLRAMPDALRAR